MPKVILVKRFLYIETEIARVPIGFRPSCYSSLKSLKLAFIVSKC